MTNKEWQFTNELPRSTPTIYQIVYRSEGLYRLFRERFSEINRIVVKNEAAPEGKKIGGVASFILA